jgi:5-methyltetrahydrofolate--homocysteine methyltransferase
LETRVTSSTKEVIISDNQPTVLIGERINLSANKRLAEALKTGNMEEIVRKEAVAQVEAGADMLDVNMAFFGVDEATLLPQAVKVAMEAVDVPLCIDSSDPAALEAALKIYKGKPLINSVTGEEHSLGKVLPLAKKYKAAVVGLVQDDEGVPKDKERRVSVAHKLVERAESVGISREDVIIDCLALAIGADTSAGPEVIKAISQVKAELGVNQTLGASNVSFGLPKKLARLSEPLTFFSVVISEPGVMLKLTGNAVPSSSFISG